MGLPGAGKTTLAQELVSILMTRGHAIHWLNADDIREKYNDWDFSHSGRIRQAERMSQLANKSKAEFVICDFIAPTKEIRSIFGADYTIWVNTIQEGRFNDTNKIFEPPLVYNFLVDKQDARIFAIDIYNDLIRK